MFAPPEKCGLLTLATMLTEVVRLTAGRDFTAGLCHRHRVEGGV
jgi:hypothetical protein